MTRREVNLIAEMRCLGWFYDEDESWPDEPYFITAKGGEMGFTGWDAVENWVKRGVRGD